MKVHGGKKIRTSKIAQKDTNSLLTIVTLFLPGQTSPELCHPSGEHCPVPHTQWPGTSKLKMNIKVKITKNALSYAWFINLPCS